MKIANRTLKIANREAVSQDAHRLFFCRRITDMGESTSLACDTNTH